MLLAEFRHLYFSVVHHLRWFLVFNIYISVTSKNIIQLLPILIHLSLTGHIMVHLSVRHIHVTHQPQTCHFTLAVANIIQTAPDHWEWYYDGLDVYVLKIISFIVPKLWDSNPIKDSLLWTCYVFITQVFLDWFSSNYARLWWIVVWWSIYIYTCYTCIVW